MDQERPWRPTEALAAAVDGAHSISEVADALAAYAQVRLPVDAVGVTLQGDQPATPQRLAAAGPLVGGLDALLHEQGAGPTGGGLECGTTLDIADTRHDGGWAGWSAAADRHGVRSLHLVGLLPLGRTWARLDLFSQRPHAFGTEDVERVDEMASGLGLVLRLAHRVMHLEEALQTRDLIGQGQGLLMERYGLAAGPAMSVLRRRSQESQVKLREVAQELVDDAARTAEPVGPGREVE